MFFGGNKNLIKKILVTIAVVVFVFGFSDSVEAQSSPINELSSKIRACESEVTNYVSGGPGISVPSGTRTVINLNKAGCQYSTEQQYEEAKEQLNTLIEQKQVQDEQAKIAENEQKIEDLKEKINEREAKIEEYSRAVNECYSSAGQFNSSSEFCSKFSNTSRSSLENIISVERGYISEEQKEIEELGGEIEDSNEKIDDLESCGIGNFGCHLRNGIKNVLTFTTNTIVGIVGIILRGAAIFLNTVIDYTIINASEIIEGENAIKNGWLIFRDLINILFIFGLLYISILTIISGLGTKTRKMLVNIILSALLINFSFFFTALLIDASNFLTIEVYKQLGECAVNQEDDGGVTEVLGSFDNGIANCFMSNLKLQTTLNPTESGKGIASELVPGQGTKLSEFSSSDAMWTVFRDSLITVILGSAFIIVTSFVFVALGIMLVIRFVMLIILLMTSPVMFLAWVLPQFSKITSKWTKALTENLLWVPFSFLFLFLTLKIMESINVVGSDSGFSTILNYVILITFTLASIMIAKNLGAAGASKATKWSGVATAGLAARGASFMGRNTLGRGAAKIADKIDGTTRTGQFFKKGFQGVAGSTFDARNNKAFQGVASATGINAGKGVSYSYQQRIDEKAAKKKEYSDSLGKQTQSERIEIDNITQQIQKESADQFKEIDKDKKAIDEDRQELGDLRSQMQTLTKGTDEYKAVEKQANNVAKRMKERQDNIKKTERDIVNNHKDKMAKIDEIKNKAKDRQKDYLERLDKRMLASDKEAVRKIRENMRNKDGKTGNIDNIIKNYEEIEKRKTAEETLADARETDDEEDDIGGVPI